MSLLNSFDFSVRTNNPGKFTAAPLLVRFTCDGVVRRRTGESSGSCLAQRWVEKQYSWRGYTLQAAKAIANFYAQGNATRAGYYRGFRSYSFDPLAGWTYTTTFKTMSTVRVSKMDGDMYAVDITVDECDEFLVDENNVPNNYDGWCGAFSAFYQGAAWAAVSIGTAHPYLFETYYDEPLTEVS